MVGVEDSEGIWASLILLQCKGGGGGCGFSWPAQWTPGRRKGLGPSQGSERPGGPP